MREFKRQKSWILQQIYHLQYGSTRKSIPLGIRDQRVWRVWKMFSADTGVKLTARGVDHLKPGKQAVILDQYRKWHAENKKRVYRVIASEYWGEQKDPEPVDLARTCDHCGNEYTPKRAGSKYCSTKHRVAAHRA